MLRVGLTIWVLAFGGGLLSLFAAILTDEIAATRTVAVLDAVWKTCFTFSLLTLIAGAVVAALIGIWSPT